MFELEWYEKGREDYLYWQKSDKAILGRVNELLADMKRNPFEGIGKPEPPKWGMAGYWSRRITKKHRIVYKVAGGLIVIYSCRGHYG
jgi:toxin YoeB